MGLPDWRKTFDRVERAVGAPLEEAVATARFGQAVSLWVQAQRTLDRAVRKRIDDQLANVLHLLNIPTRQDVQRLSRQLATTTAEVRSLSLPADRIAEYVFALQQRELAGEQASLTAGSPDRAPQVPQVPQVPQGGGPAGG